MKILLTAINAKYIHSNLALFSLKAYAKDYKENIELAEYTINHRTDYILQEIYKKKPDVLCFSCYIWNLSYVREIAMEFHKLCPQIPIWAGGPEVSYETKEFLQNNPCFTGVMIGEGEETFTDLCTYYMQTGKSSLNHINGIAYRTMEHDIVFTESREPMCIDEIPFAYEDLKEFENRIIYYESSRGCPFRCSYCLSSVEKTLRFRSLKLVEKELDFFLKNKVTQVKFVDRTFNCDHAHAMGIWRFIKENDNGITNFHFEIAADLLKEEEIAYLQTFRPGLVQLEIGVQSTNEPTIEEIHRTMNLEELKKIVKKVKVKENIHQHLDLIAGLPFEDRKAFQRSFDEIYELKPEQLQLGFLKVLKGSYMYEHAKEYELIYHAQPPYEVLSTKWMRYDEILEVKIVEEMLEVYYNSGQFPMSIRLLETLFSSVYEMFLSIGTFYEKKGYFSMKHTRIRRLEILLEFVEENYAQQSEIVKQMAVFDLYSRENAKSRPAFAKDEKEWKELTHQYCKNGKMQHLEQFSYEIPQKETFSKVPKKTASYYIVFDYAKKDKLTGQVQTQILEVIDQEERENT